MRKSGISIFLSPILVLSCLLFAASICFASADAERYISIDEIEPDMEAYCLTVFSGLEVERFELKLLSVVRGIQPGQDMILVVGTDERFQHAGTVHGCSGSPVYIDGRLAGALAAGWDGGLDSLYLVRPIHNMLAVGSVEASSNKKIADAAFYYDFSQPLDLSDIYQQSINQMQGRPSRQGMLLPLVSSLPASVCESLEQPLRQMGLVPVSGVGLMPSAQDAGEFQLGGTLSVPLCSGDISLAATGTVTEIVGDQVYGFGHSFTSMGPVNFPMSAGLVHTVVAGRGRSFKLATPGPVLGTLEADQSSAVRGTVGKMPELIPFTIKVARFNDPEDRVYRCQLAVDRMYTPMITRVAAAGAAQMQGDLPMEHTIRYHGRVQVAGRGAITFENISSGQDVAEIAQMLFSVTSLLLNNPFEPMKIESIDLSMDIVPVSRAADIRAVDVSRTRVKPGQEITAAVSLKSFRSKEIAATLAFTVPDDLPDGQYKLQIMGDRAYQRFVSQAAPHRFRVFDGDSLMEGLRRVTGFKRNRLHAVMAVPSTGIVLSQHELAGLPQTKMLLMQDTKRLRSIAAYNDWAESSTTLEQIVDGTVEIQLTVKR